MANAQTKRTKVVINNQEIADPTPVAADEPTVIASDVEIIERSEAQTDSALSIVGGITTDQLKVALKTQTEQRALIASFIRDHLIEDTDFGKIHVMPKDKCPNVYDCKIEYHYGKPMLFKPGQEKLFSLFQITDKLEKDTETLEMFGSPVGLIAFKCVMYRQANIIGEGRGSAMLGDARRDANSTIKIAEKRARMDACLSLGFSEYFSQDLDDPDYKNQAEQANKAQAAEAERLDKDEFGLFPRDASEPIDDRERFALNKMIIANGFSDPDEILELLRANGINPLAITSGEARGMMKKLKSAKFALPQVKNPDVVVTDADGVDLYKDLAAAEAEAANTPVLEDDEELVIDDELKGHVQEMYTSLGLNQRGDMWLKKIMTGKPWAKWADFTDQHWTKAYSTLMDIMDEHVTVPDDYLLDPHKQQSLGDEETD